MASAVRTGLLYHLSQFVNVGLCNVALQVLRRPGCAAVAVPRTPAARMLSVCQNIRAVQQCQPAGTESKLVVPDSRLLLAHPTQRATPYG
jgi:hypothetical protein